MIDFSLLARVDEAIKKHAHERVEIFRQNVRPSHEGDTENDDVSR